MANVGGTMISAMGNKYTPIGQAEVDKVRNAGDINSVLMTGYENNIANLSNTYDHAQNQLINKVRELIAQLSFKDPTRNAAIQQQIQNLQRSWDPQAGTFSGYDPKLNPTYFPDHGASPLNHPNTGGMASTMGGIATADYLSGARLPQGNFFGSVLNDDTSTYRSAPKGAMTLPTATKMGSQARLKSGGTGGSSAPQYINPWWSATNPYAIPERDHSAGIDMSTGMGIGIDYDAIKDGFYTDPSGRKTFSGKPLPYYQKGQFGGGIDLSSEGDRTQHGDSILNWDMRIGGKTLGEWTAMDPKTVNLADFDPDLAKLPTDVQAAILGDWENYLLGIAGGTSQGESAILGSAGLYAGPYANDIVNKNATNKYIADGYDIVKAGKGGDPLRTHGTYSWQSLEGVKYVPGIGLTLPSQNFRGGDTTFLDKFIPAAILALGTAGIGSGIAGAAGLSGVAGQAVGGAIAGGVAGGINAGMNDTNLLAGIGRGALFGGLGGAAKGAFMGDGGLGSAGGGGGGGGGGDLGDLGGGLSLNSSGTGLQYPTFDPTTQLPDTLGSGVTTPDSFFPTFDAETLNLPEFLTSQTGYGLNPNTAGTGLRPPTTPGLGTMGNAQGLTLDVPDGTLSQAGFVPSGSSLYAPTNLPYDEANYISNPFTANPDPVVSNPGPEQSTLDKLTNGYKSLPPGLQSTIERLGAPLVTNAIETILGGGGGGDTTGLEVGTTPDYNTDPGTGLEPGDLSAYLPYGIGWRGMKGDKAKKYSKRKAGATASPNFEEDRYGVMKIGQKRVRAQKQSTKPGRTYG